MIGSLIDPRQGPQIFIVHNDKLVVLGLMDVHFHEIRVEMGGLFQGRNRILHPVAIDDATVGNRKGAGQTVPAEVGAGVGRRS